jgi:hypothetical protein
MTPRDHRDDRETTVFPQALVRDLRAQEGALPEALRRQCLAAGAAMVPALIALLLRISVVVGQPNLWHRSSGDGP